MPIVTPPSASAALKRRPALPNLPELPEAHDERRLRIALVTEYYYPHLGGVCEHVHFFAREARRRGHHVDIITSNIPGAEPQPQRHPARLQSAGVRERLAGARHGWAGTAATMRRVLHEGNYDIVHVHSPLTPIAADPGDRGGELLRSSARSTRISIGRSATRLGRRFLPEAGSTCCRRRSRVAQHHGRPEPLLRSAPWQIIPNGIDTDVFHPSVAAPPGIRKDVPIDSLPRALRSAQRAHRR